MFIQKYFTNCVATTDVIYNVTDWCCKSPEGTHRYEREKKTQIAFPDYDIHLIFFRFQPQFVSAVIVLGG